MNKNHLKIASVLTLIGLLYFIIVNNNTKAYVSNDVVLELTSKNVVISKVDIPVITTTTTIPIDLSNVNFLALSKTMYGKCGEWHDLALSVGWDSNQWEKINFVMFRESRCQPDVLYIYDQNGGSSGLMQINRFWCLPWSGSKIGWLQERGVLNNCEQLYDPKYNLSAALAIWNYSEIHNGCGWRPWSTKC